MVLLLSNLLAAWKIKLKSGAKVEPKIVSTASTSSTTMASTRDVGNEEAEALISQVLDIYGKLHARGSDDLKPCDEVNHLFIDLVGMCVKTISEDVTNKVLNDARVIPILPSLRKLCGAAECHLESHWAKYISGDTSSTSKNVHDRLAEFPYYSNYVDLTRMELSALNSLIAPSSIPLHRFAFIGSGPLPLTSLCIYQTAASFTHPGQNITAGNSVEVLNIDVNPKATSESTQLCKLLGPSASGMKFQCSPAHSSELDLSGFDVVYLAALVGSTQAEKEVLLESVVGRMREGAYLVVRSAERLRRLLYAEFDPTAEKVLDCLDICLAVHPYNFVVNSVIIGKVRSRNAAKE
ncbi:Nicotianamine synthase [Rhexocercosporidium sp. MPI-PUGE-AT-0058]|nr:Nicotianamine synthase [Rhexocercosporidium sp. MPI-PUGE-AT-0058]